MSPIAKHPPKVADVLLYFGNLALSQVLFVTPDACIRDVRVASTFFELVRLNARLEAAEENIAEHERLLALIERRSAQGIGSPSEVITAKARLQRARSERLQLQTAAFNARADLSQATGTTVSEIRAPKPDLNTTNDLPTTVQKVIDHSPQIRRLRVVLPACDGTVLLIKESDLPKEVLASSTCPSLVIARNDLVQTLIAQTAKQQTSAEYQRAVHAPPAQNLHTQLLSVRRQDREVRQGHPGFVLWFTGLSGSGKSTIANALEQQLHAQGWHTYVLDGDNVRQGLNKDLGFADADRVENIRRVAEVAKLMVDAGLVVITAFISPFQKDRQMARELIGSERFLEVYVNTPLEICESRDIKGLYNKARNGLIPNMTGISSPYEAPEDSDGVVVVSGAAETWDGAVQTLAHRLEVKSAAITAQQICDASLTPCRGP